MPKQRLKRCNDCNELEPTVQQNRFSQRLSQIVYGLLCDRCFLKRENQRLRLAYQPGSATARAAAGLPPRPPSMAHGPAHGPMPPAPVAFAAPAPGPMPAPSAPVPFAAPAPGPMPAPSAPVPFAAPAPSPMPPPPAPVPSGAGPQRPLDNTWMTQPAFNVQIERNESFNTQINWANIDFGVDPQFLNANSILIGDLHGNTATLLIILIKSGILTFAQSDWPKILTHIFRPIQNFSTETAFNFDWQEYREFYEILERATILARRPPRLVFLGDILADRMSNDLLTLEVIGWLGRNNYPVSYIIGNHDLEFFRGLYTLPGMAPVYTIVPAFAVSNSRFLEFVRDHVRNDQERKRIADNIGFYIRYASLFKCSVMWSNSAGSHIFYIYSHASFQPIRSLHLIKALVGSFLDVPQNSYAELTPVAVKNLFDHANYEFRHVLENILTIWRDDPNHTTLLPQVYDPMAHINWLFTQSLKSVLWFRVGEAMSQGIPIEVLPSLVPFDLNRSGVMTQLPIRNIHGHDMTPRGSDITLDNIFGKEAACYTRAEELRLGITRLYRPSHGSGPSPAGGAAAPPSAAPPPAGGATPPPVAPPPTGGVP